MKPTANPSAIDANAIARPDHRSEAPHASLSEMSPRASGMMLSGIQLWIPIASI
jgi:hypothetical protein